VAGDVAFVARFLWPVNICECNPVSQMVDANRRNGSLVSSLLGDYIPLQWLLGSCSYLAGSHFPSLRQGVCSVRDHIPGEKPLQLIWMSLPP
jgi:hypothetical protein